MHTARQTVLAAALCLLTLVAMSVEAQEDLITQARRPTWPVPRRLPDGHVVSASTWYPAPLGTRDGLKHGGMSLISKIAVDLFKEFRPQSKGKS